MQNQILKNWQKVKLGEIGKVITGKTPPTSQKDLFGLDYPFITPTDIKDYDVRYHYSTERFVSEKWTARAKNLSLPKNSTCFVCIGSTIGKMCLVKEDSFTNQQINTVVSDSTKSDSLFIYYLLKNNQKNILKKFGGGGAAKPIINKSTFEGVELVVPEGLEEQKKIASILSAYDDLIENNNKQINILEEMAQALYKEWFVHFRFSGYEEVKMVDSDTEYGMIPGDWSLRKLGDKLNILKGKNITKNTIIHGKVPVVAGGLNPAYYHNKANAQCPVITISASGANSGFVNLYQEDVWVSDCSYIDRKTTPFVYFYYLFLKNKQIEITGLQRGSAQPHVYPKDLMQLTIIDIPEMLTNAFEQKVELMFNTLKNLKNQNQCLRQTRNLLLPKLMRGGIRV